MSIVEEVIYQRLATQLSCAVAPGIADADESMPYIVYRRSDGDHYSALSEDVVDASAVMDFECFAENYKAAKAVAVALKAAIKRWSGQYYGMNVNDVLFMTERDGIAEEKRYSVTQTYKVMYDD